MKLNLKKINKGFTLIEMLVVISIIGLLSAMVLASIASARQKAIGAKAIADTHSLANAIELYRVDHNGYLPYIDPATIVNVFDGVKFPTDKLVPKYIGTLPTVPSGSTSDWLFAVTYTGNFNGSRDPQAGIIVVNATCGSPDLYGQEYYIFIVNPNPNLGMKRVYAYIQDGGQPIDGIYCETLNSN